MEPCWEGEEEIVSEVDDKLLCDLHLNSALNIDKVKAALGEVLPYRISNFRKVSGSIRGGRRYLEGLYLTEGQRRSLTSPQPGAISAKVILSECVSEEESWSDPQVEELMNAVQEGLRGKGLKFKFDILSANLRSGGMTVPKGITGVFKEVMSLCLGISEILRGGTFPTSLKSNCKSNGRWASSQIIAPGGREYIIATDGTTVHFLGEEYSVTTWEDLLALLDTVGQRICAFLSHKMAVMIGEKGGVDEETHKLVLKELDDLLLLHGNDGYKIISMFETLCVSTILRKNPDNINDHMGLYHNLFSELSEIADEIRTNREELLLCFDRIYEILESLDNFQLSNLFCEYRIWGHPYVDIYGGMKKIHSIGTKRKSISGFLPSCMVRIFKESVVTGFYKKKHRYPKALINGLRERRDTYLKTCIVSGRPIERYSPGYLLEDWDDIEMVKMFEIPTTYDLTHILNDKAISPPLDSIVAAAKDGKPLDQMEGRRGILAWLKGNTMNCLEFLKSVEEGGIAKNELVIGMSEKEREMKNAARMFSLMSETMRYYFVITEGLIADYLLEFFPQITMKDSLNKLQKRLWTAGTKGNGRFDTNVNIDFSKWNTNMRADLMTPLFREMDLMFGMKNVISRTHQIFTDSLIYSCSGKYQPEACGEDIKEEPPMCYRGHLGGMEGLRQKGWTIGTVCLIEYIARRNQLKYNLMGQGDNQIIKLRMPDRKWDDYEWTEEQKRAEARRLTDLFVEDLERTFSEVGLPVKPKECWRSHLLFMYGKSMLLGNDVLSQWLKKVLRSYALSNEGVLTLGGTIGTISSNCMSSCSSTENPELGYAIFLFLGMWTLRFLIEYHPFNRQARLLSLTDPFVLPGRKGVIRSPTNGLLQFATMALLVPSICGGSINIPFTTYIMRGFPDPASEAYSWLKMLACTAVGTISSVCSNMYEYIAPPIVPIEQLAASPLSINHWKVIAPNLSAKKESLTFLRENFSRTNNIVKCDEDAERAYSNVHLAERLCTHPTNPLILSEFVSLFPNSVIRDLISRVQTTSTIKKLAMRTSGVTVVKRLQKGETAFIAYLRWRSSQRGEVFSSCATEHVRRARCVGWGREIVGVTTPHPLECLDIGCCDTQACEFESDYVYILRQERGGFAPYLGSTVKNKVHAVGDASVRSEPLVRGLSRIASYANWLGLGENYKDLLLELGSFYGGEGVEELIKAEFKSKGNYTGSMDHRLRTGTMAEGCFINYAPQVGTKIFLSTDNMVTYGRGNTNYTLQFQALFCWVQLAAQRTSMMHHGHAHVSCTKCVVPVSDELPDIDPSQELVLHDLKPGILDILGIRKVQRVELDDNSDRIVDFFRQRSVPVVSLTSKTLRISLTICSALLVARELMGGALEEAAEMGIGLADLQKYPRIYGKKIFTDELIEYVAMFCLVKGCIQRSLGIEGTDLYRVKRYVLNRLTHVTKDRAGGLGSLVIDRCLSDAGDFSHIDSSGACFPVTLQEHLASSLSTLRRSVQRVGSFQCFALPKRIEVPVLDMDTADLGLLLTTVDIVRYNCRGLLACYSENQSTEGLLKAVCSQNHQQKVIRSIRPLDASLDRAFKLLGTVTDSPFPSPLPAPRIPTYTYDIPRTRSVPGRTRTDIEPSPTTFSTKDLREITLPTSSVYKWEEFLNVLPHKKYIVVLGDGTGTSSYVLANYFVRSLIFPMALLERTDLTPQDLGSLRPPVTRGVTNIRCDAILGVNDDVNDPHFVGALSDFLSRFSKEEVLIISDIEMGGGSLVSSLNFRKLLDLGYPMAIKCYRREMYSPEFLLDKRLSELSVTYSICGNLEYGEQLLQIRVGEGLYLEPALLRESWLKFREEFVENDSKILIRVISDKHERLRQLSLNLSIRYLESLGITLTPQLCCTPWAVLSMYFLNYINNHYIFRADGSGNETRTICVRKRREIERLMSIILLVTTDRNFTRSDLESIKLLHLRDGLSPQFPYRNIFFVVDGYENKLRTKDLQVARCIHNLRRRHDCEMRQVSEVARRMSNCPRELLGFLNREPLGAWSFFCSSTFESGTPSNTGYLE
ncbi:TPA_asm: polyprotein [Pinus banksiana virus 1]|uniref:Replicase n=1 Tax=Pinus banksiana virus 1 TaxID=2977980 RepID=A0A9N6YJG9_9RHAB|nr:TPA_asm: polyprotein [Pinus banksiana virus 1]